MALTDMKNSVQTKNSTLAAPEMEDEYPYGLRISLDNESLAKLGITELPAIDTDMKLTALTCVVSVSQDESSGGGIRRHVTLQIEQMALEPAAEEDDEEDDKPGKMFPTMLG